MSIRSWWDRVILGWWYKDHLVFCGVPYQIEGIDGAPAAWIVGFNRRGHIIAVEVGPPFESDWAQTEWEDKDKCVTYESKWFSLTRGTFTMHAPDCGHDPEEHLDE